MDKKENISEYARRMRELAGLSEGSQKKTLKTIQEGENSFEGGATFFAKDLNKPFNSYVDSSGDKIYDLSKEFKIGPTSIEHFIELAEEDDKIYSFLKSELKSSEGVDTGNDIFWGADIFDYLRKNNLNENFMSDEMFEKMRSESINYLNSTSGWVTVLYDPNDNSLVLFKDVSGLDPERDEVEADEMENYMELSTDEVLELVKSGKVTPYLKDEIPTLNESKISEEEFETHKFEQKTIEEGENDEELYNLNEGTIIVLDFLDDAE